MQLYVMNNKGVDSINALDFYSLFGVIYVNELIYDRGELSRIHIRQLVKQAHDLGQIYAENYWAGALYEQNIVDNANDKIRIAMDMERGLCRSIDAIAEGTYLGLFAGEVLFKKHWIWQWFRNRHIFNLDIGNCMNRLIIDATDFGNHTRWFTNGQKPNVTAIGGVLSNMDYVIICYANRDISPGEAFVLQYKYD